MLVAEAAERIKWKASLRKNLNLWVRKVK